MTRPARFGPEIVLKTPTLASTSWPELTGLADGRFLATWTAPDASGIGVFAQMFNADGSTSGAEFQINTQTLLDQYAPAAAAFDDGGFIVTWTDYSATGGDLSGRAVRAQMYNADGTANGAEFLVNTTTTSTQFTPAIATLADGRFVISWADLSQTGGDLSSYAVRAQMYNADGTAFRTEFLVNTATANYQQSPAITALTNGRFVISWTDGSGTGDDLSGDAVRAQIYNADGTAFGAEFVVNTHTSGGQNNPSLAALEDGRFAVTWSTSDTSNGDTSSGSIAAQVFNADGSRLGAEFRVNTTTELGQSFPAIAALGNGRFVIAWEDASASGGDTSGRAIRAQVFDFDGSAYGNEFLVNTTTTDNQTGPSITALADGRFVVGWSDVSDNGPDPSTSGARAQIFDPRDSAIQLFGSILDDDFVGTHLGDVITGFIGDDKIAGRGGSDVLNGQDGNDTITGGRGNDILHGEDGNDILNGNTGSDQLFGGAGRDTLNGGFGVDYMAGGTQNDTYIVDHYGDMVVERSGEGTDLVKSSNINLLMANYRNVENGTLTGFEHLDIVGSSIRNTLNGNFGNNVIDGGAGKDRLWGDIGSDTLIGGLGRDVMAGGYGDDDFVFNDIADSARARLRDVITDFSQAEMDQIDLSGIDAETTAGGDQAFSFIGAADFSNTEGELRYRQTASRTIVEMDVDGDGRADSTIALSGLITLTAGDFIL